MGRFCFSLVVLLWRHPRTMGRHCGSKFGFILGWNMKLERPDLLFYFVYKPPAQRDEAYVSKIVCYLHVMASNPHPPRTCPASPPFLFYLCCYVKDTSAPVVPLLKCQRGNVTALRRPCLPLSAVTVSLHYLPRCLRSTVTCDKTPNIVTWSEH